jgi:hypothetical protein
MENEEKLTQGMITSSLAGYPKISYLLGIVRNHE